MADLATLKARIATELHRDDISDEIADAITTAIAYYRSHRFEFNELQASFNTVASQEAYTTATIPDDIGAIDSIRLTVGTRKLILPALNFQQLQALSTTTTETGQPSCWSFYARQLYFFPVPNDAYSVLVSYQQRQDAPSGDTDDTTIWTNQCEALIRHCAKKLLCRDLLGDADGFQRAQDGEGEALTVLKRESMQLQDEGGLAPSW